MDDQLKQIYRDPKRGGGGVAKLYLEARKAGVQVTKAKVKEWLERQKNYQENAPNGKDEKANWFKITDSPNSWVADSIMLRQFSKVPGNTKAAGFLLFVELTTREAYAKPFVSGKVYDVDSDSDEEQEQEVQVLDDKEVKGVFEIIKSFVEWTRHPGLGTIANPDNPNERIEIRHPINTFSSDNGKEFDNQLVRGYLEKEGIIQRFHRIEDHRANGMLNSVARVLRQTLYDHWSHEGNVHGLWKPYLQDAIDNWNNHRVTGLKASPEELKTNLPKQNDLRWSNRIHNIETWRRTAFHGQPTVLRYLRRGTEDKGLFAKTGKNWSDPFSLGDRKRTGYSYELLDHAGNKYKSGRSYRPYELKEVLGRKVEAPPERDAEKELAKSNRAERRLQREGIEPEPKELPKREPAKAPEPKQPQAPAEKQDSVPDAIMDYDWGDTRQRKILGGVEDWEPLRFLVKWRGTPEFVRRWSKYKGSFAVWDDVASNYQSWQPGEADWAKGATVQSVLPPASVRNRELVLDFIKTKVKGDKNKGDIGAEYFISKKKGVYQLNE